MKIRLALPSGSLKEATLKLFQQAGIQISVRERSYVPYFTDPEIEGFLLRAQEIPRYVAKGDFDAGITGRDWVREQGAKVREVAELPYAKTGLNPIRWIVAVPKDSPVRTIRDLNGKRISTEVVNLTRKFLKANKIRAEVEFSWGATEVKPPSLADAIVELTETGSSIRAHNLKELAVVMISTTVVIANPGSFKNPAKREKIENLVMLLSGALAARSRVGLKMNVPRSKLKQVMALLPALKNPTISSLTDPKWVSLEVIADESQVGRMIPDLKRAGATGIIEYPLNKLIY
ncbi:MAG: ATP phosphoribosyltransferase [Proteobacteria bacterium]|nr:ATP phosphoribosyltransferase [Pseudomonadota bacterium]